MRSALSLKMGYRHVRSSGGRLVLSVLAVGLGVGLVVSIRLMNQAVLQSFLDAVDGVSGRATLNITAQNGASFPEALVDAVARVRGVKLAVPLVSGIAFPDDVSGELLTVHGVDFAHDAEVRLYHDVDDASDIVDDTLAFLNDPHSVVLTRQFAEQRQLKIGSMLRLVTPSGVMAFTIRGLLEPHGLARALGGRLVVMDLYAAQRAFAVPDRINQIDVVLDPETDVEGAREAVAALLPAGVEVREPTLHRDVVRSSVAAFQSMLTAFGFLAVFAGFVICYTRLGAIFEARIWEVGILRAGGLRRSVVFWELMKESLLLGTAGALIGIPFGVIVATVALPIVATTTALASGVSVLHAHARLGAGDVALGGSLGVVAAAAAALGPALRTSRSHPVMALTMRGREMPMTARCASWRVFLILTISAIGMIVAQRLSGVPAIGLVTTALIVSAGCVLTTPLVGFGGHWLKALWTRWFGAAGGIAASSLARQPRRTALLIATLGVGLGSVLMLNILAWSLECSLVSTLTRLYRADLAITSVFPGGGYRNAPMSETVVYEIQRVPGVASAAGLQEDTVSYADDNVVVTAFDRPCLFDSRVCDWPIVDSVSSEPLRLLADGDVVAVTESFANRYGTRPGEEIILPTPSGRRAFTVGVVTSGLIQNEVIMSRLLFRSLWNDNLVSWVWVAVKEGENPKAVSSAIAGELGPKYRLRVLETTAMIEHFASQVRQAFSLQYVTEAITLLLVLIGIGDTLAASVAARTREIGMMRAVGLRRSSVAHIVVLEGAGIAVLGLALAGAQGLALGAFWVEQQFPAFLGWGLDLYVPVMPVIGTALGTLALCVAGSLLPSLRAAHLPVPAALHHE